MFLIVDDEQEVAEVIQLSLENIGIDSKFVCSAKDGIKVMQDQHFPFVIADIGMPGFNGIDFMKWARKNSPDTEIICLSGFTRLMENEIKELDLSLIIEKPFVTDEIMIHILELIDARKKHETTQTIVLESKLI